MYVCKLRHTLWNKSTEYYEREEPALWHLSWDLDIGKVLVRQLLGDWEAKGSCGKYQHFLLIERRLKGLEVSDQEGESQGGFLKTRQEVFEWRSIMDRIVPPLSPDSYFEVLTPSTSECDYIWK